ncbi:glycosyl transferase, partial [Methanobrevibacter sp. OttesenSCG-928-I08]|nr:glycosyl transferase [Methanobrevibacter sp. OttesenSCG-928-I08]
MDLKSYISKFPHLYILLKSSSFKIAKLNFKAYKLIKKNNLFDEEFYFNENNNLDEFKKNPLIHYMFFGFKEGKDPSPDFDNAFYLNEYEDANKSNLSPLAHYALYGINSNRKTKINENKILFKNR